MVKSKEIADAIAEAVESMDFSEASIDAHRAEINSERQALGLSALKREDRHLLYSNEEPPDTPSCDFCGEEYAGENACSKCRCAFYCSVECQTLAWKNDHKQACPDFKEQCNAVGKQVVSELGDESKPPLLRVQNLKHLDSAGAYKAAKTHGHNSVLRDLFVDDRDNVLERFRQKGEFEHAAYVHWIIMTLWRGQRVSRGDNQTRAKCDGGRVKGFILSHPDAFKLLWEAGIAFSMVPLDGEVYRTDRAKHAEAHQMARDVWAGFNQVFSNDRASRAILLGKKTDDEESMLSLAKERVEYIASTLVPVLRAFNAAPPGRDLRDVLEALYYQVSAMIAYRVREYGIHVDFVSMLKMSKAKTVMYELVAVPLGEGTVKKGSVLTPAESQVVMRAAAAKHTQAGKSTKRGKKSRRNRR